MQVVPPLHSTTSGRLGRSASVAQRDALPNTSTTIENSRHEGVIRGHGQPTFSDAGDSGDQALPICAICAYQCNICSYDQQVGTGQVEKTQFAIWSADETANVGMDRETPVSSDYTEENSRFTGQIDSVTITVK